VKTIMTSAETIVRSFYDALAPGHRERVFSLQDAHIVYELPDGMPTGGGRFQGLKDVLERFLPGFYGALDVHFAVEDIIASGEHVVAIGRLQGKTREGAIRIDVPFVHAWTVQDNRLQRLRFFTDTAILTQAINAGRRSTTH
jgi:ketosteroid isomerase-like protein